MLLQVFLVLSALYCYWRPCSCLYSCSCWLPCTCLCFWGCWLFCCWHCCIINVAAWYDVLAVAFFPAPMLESSSALIKKKLSSYIRKFRVRKCENISPYMRRPLVIYDFATAPLWISLYMRKIWFSFLSVRTLRVHGRRPFAFPNATIVFRSPGCGLLISPNAGKFWSLEPGKVSLQGPDFYGMEECKMPYSRDRKTFPSFGNAKGLLPGTRRVFWNGECE